MELPLGATPVKILLLSLGVKFTKDTDTDLADPLGLPLFDDPLGVFTGLGVVEGAGIFRS